MRVVYPGLLFILCLTIKNICLGNLLDIVELALHNVKAELVANRVVTARFINAIKTFEKTYTEPVANSPHGDELN